MPHVPTLNDALSQLIGTTLSSVEFVQDYVQLRFDGATLTAYTQPHLVKEGGTILWNDPGYRDSLCGLIGIRVKESQVIRNKAIVLIFEENTAVKVSIETKDYRGPEALQFTNGSGPFWVI